MTGIFSRLLISALTFSVGVFLVPSPAPLPAISSIEEQTRPPSAPPISAEPYDILGKNGNLAAIELKQLTPGEQRVRG